MTTTLIYDRPFSLLLPHKAISLLAAGERVNTLQDLTDVTRKASEFFREMRASLCNPDALLPPRLRQRASGAKEAISFLACAKKEKKG
jgi:hypothetical protein